MTNYSVGQKSRIGEFSIIEDGCEIGDNVTIENFTVLCEGTIVENNCIIRAGARIGTPPYSFHKENAKYIGRKALGKVVLRAGSEIGFNTVIQRGVERDTEIGERTMINNLCNIGHDVIIGDEVMVGLNSSISGHTEIGSRTYIAPGVTIMNRVKVGSDAFIGIGSLVLHDVNPNEKVVGRPAVNLELYKEQKNAYELLVGGKRVARVLSTKKRAWSRLFGRHLTKFRQRFLTW